MTFTATPYDLISIGMKNKLKTICPNGEFEVLVFYSEQYMGYKMMITAIAKGQRVPVADQWLPMDRDSTPLNAMMWFDFMNMFEVSDQLYATLMLLYPDMVTS